MSTLPNRTVPWLARSLGVKESKVMKFIASGELEAVNLATNRGGRRRLKISDAAIERFLAARSANANAKPVTTRRRKESLPADFVEYV